MVSIQGRGPLNTYKLLARLVVMSAVLLGGWAAAFAQESGAPAAGAYHGVPTAMSGGALEAVLFYIFAAIVLGSGLAICISKNIVRMAVFLFATLASVAVLYFLLLASFIAVIQLIVYAGGTLILLIFGVMLTSKSPWARFDVKKSELALAGVVCTLFAVVLLTVITGVEWPTTGETVTGTTVADFGTALLSDYLVPFEAVSVLLLVVMIGAALLARQD